MKTKILLFISIALSVNVWAQRDTTVNDKVVLDGAFPRENDVLRKEVPYQLIREADAMYSKKVLRYIDLNEKRNHPLYFPTETIEYLAAEGLQPDRSRRSLYSVILDVGIKQKEYPCYDYRKQSIDMTNWYVSRKDTAGIERIGTYTKIETRYEPDEYGDLQPVEFELNIPIGSNEIKAFFMWEEWVFDKQRSVMDVRIIALAPLAITENINNGYPTGLFWIHYPHFRKIFVTHEVFNSSGNKNDAERLCFDDIFFKRLFSSFIYAETNVYDNRFIDQYLMGIEAIREGERIQDMLFVYEHDQWEY